MGRKSVDKVRVRNHKKKEQLIVLLMNAFKKHGTRKYTMETIASELNISKSTLYQYFCTKDEMVAEVLMKILNDVSSFENNLKDTSLSYVDRYHKNLALFSEAFTGVSNVFIADLKIDYPLIWKNIEDFNQYVSTVIIHFYEDAINAGVFTKIDSAVMAQTDKMFFTMISDIDFLEKNNLTVNDVFESFYKMKLHGILKKTVGQTPLSNDVMHYESIIKN